MKPRTIYSLPRAFRNAFAGLLYFFRQERNGRIQAGIAALTVAAGFYFHITPVQWMAIGGCIGIVLSAEMLNSALEKLCDLVEPGVHPQIKIIKDLSAAAVLWLSIASAILGLAIFLPKIWTLI